MAETPFSEGLETIAAVARIQAQVDQLAAAIAELTERFEAIWRACARRPPSRGLSSEGAA